MTSDSQAKSKYRSYCENNTNVPIFSQPFWLDMMCGEAAWDVAIVEKNQVLIAAWPFYKKQKIIFDLITMPMLTPYLGPWLDYPPDQKICSRLAFEKQILTELVKQLPDYDYLNQACYPGFDNWLPLYWHGFKQQTLYTYILRDLSNLDDIWGCFRENIRREIRKATNRFSITIAQENDIAAFDEINMKTFQRQGKQRPYSKKDLIRIDKVLATRECRQMFFAKDPDGNIHAAIYLIWDTHTAYYIMGGGDPALRHSGATSLAMWQAIQFSALRAQSFNFEGSMIEPIARYFGSFGAEQTPYFMLTQYPSHILRCMLGLLGKV